MEERRAGIISIATRAVVTLVILFIGVALSVVIIKAKPAIPRRENAEPIEQVYVMEAQPVAVHRTWDGFGTAAARDEADVPSELTGVVVDIPGGLRAGSHVQAGQAIAILDESDVKERESVSRQTIARLQAQISALEVSEKSAREQLDLAEDELKAVTADYDRALQSYKEGGASDSEVDGKRRQYKSTARVVTELRKQLDLIKPQRDQLKASIAEEEARLAMVLHDRRRCTIVSPLTGILQSVDVNVGEQVVPGKRIAHVERLERIEIPLRFPASARSSVHVGDTVTLTNVGAVAYCWTAEVERLAPDSDPSTRTFIAYGELTQAEGDDPLLVPGMFVRASLSPAVMAEHFVIPRRSIIDDSFWVIDKEGSAERRSAKVLYHVVDSFPQLQTPDHEWAVLDDSSDIVKGDRIILTNIHELIPGMKVRGTAASAEMVSPSDDGATKAGEGGVRSSTGAG